MTRTITAAALAATQAQTGSFYHLIKIRFGGGDANVTTAGSDITFQNELYSAIGGNLSVGNIQESADTSVPSFQVTFDAVDRSLLTLVLNDTYIGRTMTVWRAYLNADSSLIANPILLGTFYMNGTWTYSEGYDENGPTTCTLGTTCSGRLIIGDFIKGIITNLKSHQRFLSTLDAFYRWVPKLSEGNPIIWNGVPVRVGPRPPDYEPPHS